MKKWYKTDDKILFSYLQAVINSNESAANKCCFKPTHNLTIFTSSGRFQASSATNLLIAYQLLK